MQSYKNLIEADPVHWEPEKNDWAEFDRDAFENPRTLGACVFLSWHGSDLIGFGSFDPRRKPELGIIGHNCILPKYRGKGFGRQQIMEILKRLNCLGIKTVKVTTNENPFFIAAQKMYESCGFQAIGLEPWANDPKQHLIHYQKNIG